ncbi:unnamed protein product, partial [Polarella glacialis]
GLTAREHSASVCVLMQAASCAGSMLLLEALGGGNGSERRCSAWRVEGREPAVSRVAAHNLFGLEALQLASDPLKRPLSPAASEDWSTSTSFTSGKSKSPAVSEDCSTSSSVTSGKSRSPALSEDWFASTPFKAKSPAVSEDLSSSTSSTSSKPRPGAGSE